ncbi:transcriptional repressor general negative regulator of transcription subunit 4 [Linderina pennispora]|nr:transcriptional repressor general negative regulator of transcription subunit 4 [Linderina pennispora]
MAKIRNEKKAKERERREIEGNNRRHLANVRVVQKNLVYILKGHDYFGQFGRINKIVINRRQAGSNAHHPTVGVYVTYATKDDAARAINAVDGSMLENRVLRATFGTTKYCSYYLRNIPCQNPGCMYLHEPGEEADSFTKEDLAANRAGFRDPNHTHHDHQDSDDDDDMAHHHHHHHPHGGNRTVSPATHLGSGRVQVVPAGSIAGFGGGAGRAHTVAPASSSSSNTMAARLRKGTDLSDHRPRSVEPNSMDNDSSTGSALPATASWASRPPAKKPEPEVKARRPEGGGTMTLRMVPSSRNKASASNATVPTNKVAGAAAGAGTSSVTATATATTAASNSNSNSSNNAITGSNQNVSARERGKSTALSGDSQAHHPVLQQLSRERKEQLRQQQRQPQSQQQMAESTAELSATKASSQSKQKSKQAEEQVAAAESKKSKSRPKEAPAADASESKQKPATAAKQAAAKQAAAKVETRAEVKADDEPKPRSAEQTSAESTKNTAGTIAVEKQDGPATDGNASKIGPESTATVAADDTGASHVTSAQSFQSIADSLFAQLNAKVSTPPTSGVPAFSATSSFSSHLGVGAFPISGVDPLLFPPSSAGGVSGSSSLFGAASAAGTASSVFDPFAAQSPSAAAQWGAAKSPAASSSYMQSPLSALIGGESRDGQIPTPATPFGGRQRSRWDFASNGNVDEASAQAELQSVLNRGAPASSSGPGFTSSRDLGLFSTPAPPSSFSWGSGPPTNTVLGNPHGQHQSGGVPAPPPGLGGAGQRSDGALRSMATNTPPGILPPSSGGAPPMTSGPGTLLSRLMGQSMDGGAVETAASSQLFQQQQQQGGQFQDPAILSTHMGAMAGGLGGHQQYQQQQQQANRSDPNVLNSLLARLQLGGASAGMTMQQQASPLGPGLAQQHQHQHQHQHHHQHQNQHPPGMMPMGMMQGAAGLVSPLFAGQFGQQVGGMMAHPPQMGVSSAGGFVDPAIMQVGRMNGMNQPVATAVSTGPVGPPPGITSPLYADAQQQQHSTMSMPSRSANSSGRSRFLTHFSSENETGMAAVGSQQQQQPPHRANAEDSRRNEREDAAPRMVNGVPPGLPSTGLFGELLRQTTRQGGAAPDGSAASAGAATASMLTADGSNIISGKMMLGDIERQLVAAQREARELQAQLSTVKGQNQSALWNLVNSSGNGVGMAASAAAVNGLGSTAKADGGSGSGL